MNRNRKLSVPRRHPLLKRCRVHPLPQTASGRQSNARPGVFQQINPMNWFRNASPAPKVTPPASSNPNNNPAKPAPKPRASNLTAFGTPMHPQTKPVRLVQPAPPSFPRYLYLSPAPPGPGNRPAAGRAFAQAQQFERDKQYLDALDSYREAARLDPGWFEAQYNCGVMAYRLGDFNESLPCLRDGAGHPAGFRRRAL